MKLWIPIDQRASIVAGYEAPHSTRIVDVPVERIPAPIRAYIAPLYDPASGELSDKTPDGVRIEMPQMMMPLTVDNALAWLQRYYQAHQAAARSTPATVRYAPLKRSRP
jgi:hypothetical protein